MTDWEKMMVGNIAFWLKECRKAASWAIEGDFPFMSTRTSMHFLKLAIEDMERMIAH